MRINITGNNVKMQRPWMHSIPVNKKFWITGKINNVNYAVVTRNYYIDTKSGKIRYENYNNLNNASYTKLFFVYLETMPGNNIYAYAGNSTNSPGALSDKLNLKSFDLQKMEKDKIQSFIDSLLTV